jgi:hypothetical protein
MTGPGKDLNKYFSSPKAYPDPSSYIQILLLTGIPRCIGSNNGLETHAPRAATYFPVFSEGHVKTSSAGPRRPGSPVKMSLSFVSISAGHAFPTVSSLTMLGTTYFTLKELMCGV